MNINKENMSLCILLFLILAICFLTTIAYATPVDREKKKVAVVLSGGGAKGTAHIGALKVLEEVGIQPDYIVGTSMGAIIGGLYSIGYASNELDSLVRSQDWTWLLSDRKKRSNRTLKELENENRYILSIPLKRRDNSFGRDGLVRGQNINNLFSELTIGYHDSVSFSTFPIAFACIATDIADGSEIVLNKGVLAEAMRASMAIPGMFSPVRKDSMILVDGGLVNNFPVDVARRMGADIVIGIDVQDSPHDREKLNSLSEIISQIIDIACRNKYEQNRLQTDVYIKVNVEDYTAASFTSEAIDSLIHRGYIAATRCRNELETIPTTVCDAKEIPILINQPPLQKIYISTIHFVGVNDAVWNHDRMIKKCRLVENSPATTQQIEDALTTLRNEMDYSYVDYRLQNEGKDSYRLTFLLEGNKRTTLNLGVRFDTEEVLSLLIKTSAELPTHIPSILSVTGKLGKQYMAQLQYTLKALQMHDFNFGYTYCYHDIDVYNKGDRISNATYNYHNLEVDYTSMRFRNFRYKFGVGFEFYHNPSLLYRASEVIMSEDYPSEHFFKYFLQTDYNTQDRNYFPTQGFKFQITGTLYTDNMVQYNRNAPFYAISGMLAGAIPLNRHFTIEPAVYGRIIDGEGVPYFYANALGGEYPSKYFPQQLPFIGIKKVELTDDVLLAGYFKLRYHIGGKHYLSLIGNTAVSSTHLYDVFKGEFIYGIGLCYGFDSKFGPLEASVSYSNRTENMNCYVNLGYFF
uniref:patatin-like phospholipase family protein n=1 Tax=Bacteroides caccae TaxID=47678 RepID=UPI00359C8F7C